ncbi:leucine-rich repeat domain-containing protein [Bernardetia sp. OM2101]|uniref:leucine-rich repeat domain-containing protein n=1 Tax=Bernardetia sp. OM2101 TaxID=3344876 RepID=UPI0035CF2498
MKPFIKFILVLLCAFVLTTVYNILFNGNVPAQKMCLISVFLLGGLLVFSLIVSSLISIFFIKKGKFKVVFKKSIFSVFILSFFSLFLYESYSEFESYQKNKKYREETRRITALSLEEKLEEEFIKNPKQTFLHITDSKDSIFPKNIDKFSHIDFLLISQTNIRTLPKEFAQLINLELLVLQRNKFDTLPEIIFELQKLERLNIMGNKITYISPNIKKLENLKELIFYSSMGGENYLKSIPKEMGELKNLEHLTLHNIDSFPLELGNLDSLSFLMLNQTSFDSFPAFMFKLKNIEQITIAFRPTQPFPPHITKDFEKLKTLKHLRFMYIYPSEEEKKKLQELLPNTEIEY